MVKKNKGGSLTKEERSVAKALLNQKWRNQDIQNLINTGRSVTINSARITEIKQNDSVKEASKEQTDFYIKKKDSYDNQTGLNLYDDERLIRARESMILAVNVFNNPSLKFKTEVFAVLANIAWTYLLHEFYERKGEEIEGDDGRTLLLSHMVRREDCPLSSGIINNLVDLIRIRSDVEHKILMRSDYNFFPKFQACCLNFDKTICKLFGEKLSLKKELSFALQFMKLDMEQISTMQKFDIPEHIQTLDAELGKDLSEEEKSDIEYQFKVIYTLEGSSKSKSHVQFIMPGSEEGKEIHNILVKHKLSDELYPFKPSTVVKEVNKKSKNNFSSHNHTQAMYFFKARPKGKSKNPENTNKEFCIYHPAHKDYTYSQKWIDHLINHCNDDTKYKAIKAFR